MQKPQSLLFTLFSIFLMSCSPQATPTVLPAVISPGQPASYEEAQISTETVTLVATQPTQLITTGITPHELGGSQAWIEKNFKPLGFQFREPVKDGDKIAVYGELAFQKENGDRYDMEIVIRTVSTGYSLIRAEMNVLVPQRLSGQALRDAGEIFHLFWNTSTNNDLPEGITWIDLNLDSPEIQKSRTSFQTRLGLVQASMSLGGWLSDKGEGYGYLLTLWVDQQPTYVGDSVHISVEAITPLQDGDMLWLHSSDYEDAETVNWSTWPTCIPHCETNSPNVKVSDKKITVYDGFPVTHDQWGIAVELDSWSESLYPPYIYHLEIIFHGRTYSCTNKHEFSSNENFGLATISVELKNGVPYFYTDDPVGMTCSEE